MWIKLSQFKSDALHHGAILRFRASYPYENVVDLMVFEPIPFEGSMGLIVTTGFKAGLIANILPIESAFSSGRSVSRDWLLKSWSHWILPGSDSGEVFVLENYMPPQLPE